MGPTRIVRFEHLDEPSSLPAGTHVLPSILQPLLPITTIRATRSRAGDRIAGDATKTREVVCRPSLSSRLRWPRRVGGGCGGGGWNVECSRRKGICKPTAVDSFEEWCRRQRIYRSCTVSSTISANFYTILFTIYQ